MFRKIHPKGCSSGTATNGETETKACGVGGGRGKIPKLWGFSGGGCSDAGAAKAETAERSRGEPGLVRVKALVRVGQTGSSSAVRMWRGIPEPARPRGVSRLLEGREGRRERGWGLPPGRPGPANSARAITSCTPPSCCCAMASNMPSNRSSSCSPPIVPAASHAPKTELRTRVPRSPILRIASVQRLQSSAFRSGAGNTQAPCRPGPPAHSNVPPHFEPAAIDRAADSPLCRPLVDLLSQSKSAFLKLWAEQKAPEFGVSCYGYQTLFGGFQKGLDTNPAWLEWKKKVQTLFLRLGRDFPACRRVKWKMFCYLL